MLQTHTVSDLDIKGKKVLVRVDFNVPIENGRISDNTRIRASIPTLQLLLKKGASQLILMSHLGRPQGRDASDSLKPIADELQQLMQQQVIFLADPIFDPAVQRALESLPNGSIALLENLRFYEAEEKPEKDPLFAKKLAQFGDVYINDAFGTAHRAHSSTATIAQFFPKSRGIGLLMEKEVAALGKNFNSPSRPFSAIIGGAKVSSKLGVLSALLKKADMLFIGGAMSYTFLKAQGIATGDSLVEEGMVEHARTIMKMAKEKRVPIYLPIDITIVEKGHLSSELSRTISIIDEGIPTGYEGVDIGAQTVSQWAPELQKSKTIFWNGPVGVFETPPFNKGTNAIAHLLASLQHSAYTVIGGGDSVSAIEKLGISELFSHISTGGGASLEFIEKGSLPGIDALQEP
ncbi:MAG: phosphoglycerate kinase [Chlamydia sp.]